MSEYVFNNPDKYARAVAEVGDQDVNKVVEEYIKLGGAYYEDGVIKNVLGSPDLANPLKPAEKAKAAQIKKVATEGVEADNSSNPPKKAIAPKPKLKDDKK